MMEIKDFRAVKLFDYYGKAPIWGEQVGIGIDCDIITLEAVMPAINSLISFLNDSKSKIVSALAENSYHERAEDYATTTVGVEPVPYETNTWLMSDGTRVHFPLTEDDFAGYLYIEGISIIHAVPPSDIKANVYLITRPDLFDEHCINLIIDSTGSFDIDGLERKDYKGYSFDNEADLTRNFDAIYNRHVEKGFGFIKLPNPDEQPLSHWTYSDMKREYKLSVERFKARGYSDEECCSTAYRCTSMNTFHSCSRLTEQVMARTVEAVYRIENGLFRNTEWYKDVYIDIFVKEYREAPAKGFTQPEQDKAEFERDIDFVISKIEALPVEERISQSRYDTAKAIRNLKYRGLNLDEESYEKMRKKDTESELRLQQMRELLSPAAFELITEYDFSKTDIELFEQYILTPLGLQMTEPLKRFLELYDGTVFAYHTHRVNEIDRKYSRQNFDGFSVTAYDYVAIGKDGKYYIVAMNIHYAGDCTIYVGSDGKIYKEYANVLLSIADSMEEFLEQHAHIKALADDFLARRIELDNKYLIPEIRASSM